MERKLIIRGTDITVFLYALVGFWALNPYIIWNELSGFGGIGPYLPRVTELLLFISLVVFDFPRRTINKSKLTICVLLIMLFQLVLIFRSCSVLSIINIYSRVSKYLAFALFLLLDEEMQARIFKLFVKLYIIALVPALIVLLLHFVGVSVPFSIIRNTYNESTYTRTYYRMYPGAVYRTVSYLINFNQWRICGMMTEPGVIGTFSAFIAICTMKKIKEKPGLWINILGGILSFSLAFYVMSIIGLVLRFVKKNKKAIFIIIGILFLGYYLFISIDFKNEQLTNLQQRIIITNGALNGDNRENSSYKKEFDMFLDSGDAETLLFGNGEGSTLNNPNMVESFSYKSIIYDYGFIGFTFIIFWISLCAYFTSKGQLIKNLDYFSLFIVFILSIYQRPNVLDAAYIIALFGGLSYMERSNKDGEIQLV